MTTQVILDKINSLKADIAGVATDVGTVKDTTTKISVDADALKTLIQNLQGQITAGTLDGPAISAALDTAIASADSLKADADSAAGSLSSAQASLDALAAPPAPPAPAA